MKKSKSGVFLFLVLISLSGSITYGQNSTFLLIDVSGNPLESHRSTWITKEDRAQALGIAQGIMRQNLDLEQYPEWSLTGGDDIVTGAIQGSNRSLLQQNDIFVVMPYGERDTYKQFQLFNSDSEENMLRGFEHARKFKYQDQQTFGKIANAKVADVAIDANLNSYYLIEIAGLGGDQTGSAGLSPRQNEIINLYESSVIIESMGVFQRKGKEYRVSIRKIDIKDTYSQGNTAGTVGIIKPDNVQFQKLKLVSPTGTRSNPYPIDKENNLHISWIAIGKEPNTTFTVIATNTVNNKAQTQRCTDCNGLTMKLDPGTYSIQLRASEMPVCQNNNQIVKVKRGFPTAIIWLILIALMLFMGFKYLKRKDPFGWFGAKQEERKKKTTDDNVDNINI